MRENILNYFDEIVKISLEAKANISVIESLEFKKYQTNILKYVNSLLQISEDMKLIDRYENVGRVMDENGRTIRYGVNWLNGIEFFDDKLFLAKQFQSIASYQVNNPQYFDENTALGREISAIWFATPRILFKHGYKENIDLEKLSGVINNYFTGKQIVLDDDQKLSNEIIDDYMNMITQKYISENN